ncbi:hypothetical protein OWM54_26720 [Myxococcus sp. MISCRS1]|uniref:hypothetical protein n=1 Tax=Myxococcus TaxID=32 RepID=UPI001890BCDB|nr:MULTISPECIES: hypothetical protein [unclassified Myxococcus]MBZ4396199.1 hypothetical protein [Myxococcus sp. AS-1-15]MBZ4408690.1 hypothetical protein [Myxococcus sp. XM-1-1-1]MCY1000747.1 hypothetical protein [Myxococcus sp. MISCRS1]
MKTCLVLLAALAASGCYDRASYVYGESMEDLTLQVHDATMGVHPSTTVLDDPNNPFVDSTPGTETKWLIQANAGPVASFYAWATLLARGPYGEAQYYVGLNLLGVYQNGLASQQDLPVVRELAIKAYQSVLDNFPDAVTYDATGTIQYELVTPAYKAIVEMGGTVTGGWVLVRTSSGADKAVRP